MWTREAAACIRELDIAVPSGSAVAGNLLTLLFAMQEAESDRPASTQPGTGPIAGIAVNGLHVEQDLKDVGWTISIAQGQWPAGVAQTEGDGCFEVFWCTNTLLTDIRPNVHNSCNDALRDKAAAVLDHADRLSVAGHQRMGGLAHVMAGGWIGGQYAPFAACIVNQHVDSNGLGGVKTLHHCHGGDVKGQWRHQGQCIRGRRCARFNFRTQVPEQCQ
jgi:hypothetical protein